MTPPRPFPASGRCLVPLFALLGCGLGARADSTPAPAAPRQVGWSSKFQGTPDPPRPYSVEPVFPRLKFELPVLLAEAPGTGRLFIGGLKGKVWTVPNDPAAARADLALDLKQHRPDASALYGLAFHPKFETNRYVYLCYVVKDGQPDGTRVSRFAVRRTDPPTIDPASETVVITWLAGGHNGGCLAFGPDGYLYVSTGDAAGPSPPDTLDTGQDVSDLLSSILRVDVDHPDAATGREYRVPPDNPLVKVAGARPEIWAYGLRNPWRMSFDRSKGDLWVGDVGWELWELVDRVERGGNYGWSVVEGRQPVRPEGRKGPTPILPPTVVHPHTEAASITGGYVWHGPRLPELAGTYVYGDFQSGKVWGLRHDGRGVTWQGELAETPLHLVSFGEDVRGEVYLIDHDRTGQVYRLVKNPDLGREAREFPRLLSRSGLFTSTSEQAPAPGVVPYEVNAAMWSDHATAERFLALPGRSQIKLGPKGEWVFPEGAVVARTVSLEATRGDASTRRRLETQVLHLLDGSWRPYSYVWNDGQTDATLAPAEGLTRRLDVRDPEAPGGRREQEYRVHSRTECVICHNPWVEARNFFGRQSASPLALYTSQLNRDVRPAGAPVNQLREFERLGLFEHALTADLDSLPKTADPYDPSADLGRRARAYLAVNCSHCHRFNAGGTATIWLQDDLPLDKMQIVGVKPTQGAFGISDARLVNPGDVEGSVLFYRVAKLGGGRMPRVGSGLVDEKAVSMLAEWISAMPRPSKDGPPPRWSAEDQAALKKIDAGASVSADDRAKAVRRLTATTRGAVALMRRIDRGALDGPARRQAVAIASGDARPEIRDLFERFLPESERVRRLGDSFDPQTVLSLPGDARRGREVFFKEPSAQCRSCHRLENQGEPLGPDLAHIGAKYPKPEMLRHIIEPSKAVDPKYVAYLVETKSGQVVTGVIAERNDREVVLRDARNQPTRIPAGDVEQMAPQSRSLMPELLLRDLTAQQAADLLEFLAGLR
jgi:uncharacterized repeat protein (TIGR03806 family)